MRALNDSIREQAGLLADVELSTESLRAAAVERQTSAGGCDVRTSAAAAGRWRGEGLKLVLLGLL